MAFYRIGKVTQYLIELLVVLGFGIMFCNIAAQAQGAWLIFGVVFGGVLSHGIMEMIQEGDIRRVMAHKGVLTAAVASSMVIFGIYYWDVFQYDEFLPKQEELKAVSIRSDDGFDYSGEDESVNDQMQKAMEQMARDPQVYEALKQVLKTHVGGLSNGNGKWWGERLAAIRNGQESVNIRYVRVRYALAGGQIVHRKYLADYDKSRQQLMALYDSQDYKKTIFPLTVMTEEELMNKIEAVEISSIDNIFGVPGNQETKAEFLKTYRAELLQLSSETLERERPVGKIQLEANWGYMSEDGETMTDREAAALSNQEYYIYPSFVRTLALLKSKGIELLESIPSESVEHITVYENEQKRVIKDRGQIEKILPELVCSEIDDGIMSRMDDVTVDVKLKKDGQTEYITCIWRGDV